MTRPFKEDLLQNRDRLRSLNPPVRINGLSLVIGRRSWRSSNNVPIRLNVAKGSFMRQATVAELDAPEL
ncbi:MAG: hypothetical protein WBN36_09665, partial [Gammaproteobacteria bacterium]